MGGEHSSSPERNVYLFSVPGFTGISFLAFQSAQIKKLPQMAEQSQRPNFSKAMYVFLVAALGCALVLIIE